MGGSFNISLDCKAEFFDVSAADGKSSAAVKGYVCLVKFSDIGKINHVFAVDAKEKGGRKQCFQLIQSLSQCNNIAFVVEDGVFVVSLQML